VIEVLRTGPLATVQDLGRPGLGHLGVSPSGAADRASLRLANRLVGNPESSAGVEVTLGGLAVRFSATATVACTGAPAPLRVGGRPARARDVDTPLVVLAGEVLELGVPPTGLRTYLAVRGGIAVPAVLGSRATDTLAGLGPPALRPGVHLPVGPPPHPATGEVGAQDGGADDGEDVAQVAGEVPAVVPTASIAADITVRALPGPRDDWFVDGALATLASAPYLVTEDCDRVGVRLQGPALARRSADELKSEGTVRGALQVPPSGQPILFLSDHPVTGGYPVVAVVAGADVDRAAQLRPGGRLRFRVVPAR
jgi:biotin-dependent carboxylase-like uncharacterized protein